MGIDDLARRYGPRYRWLATGTAMTGTIATVLSSTIVNVALPDVMGAFGLGQDQAQWLSTGFLASMTATMLLNAWAVRSFGQRATFISAMLVFTAGSLLGGLSPNEGVLVLGRVLQGAAAGIVQPLAMLVIFQVFPPDRRGQAMGIYGVGVVLAPALGPTIGGLMVDHLSWRYVFFLGVPFCLTGIGLAAVFMPGRPASDRRVGFDWPGFALLVVFLAALLTGLSNGQREGWWSSDLIVGSFALAAATGAAFLVHERRAAHPMLELGVFGNGRFAAASVVAFVFGAGIFGSTYLLPLFVQTIQGYTATRSGLLLMPAGLVLGLVFPLAGRLTDRLAPPVLVITGLVAFGLSSHLMAGVDVNTPFAELAAWVILGRMGLGFVMPALNAGALRALAVEQLGQGSGAINFVRQLGGAFGVNLLALVLDRRTLFHSDALAASQTAGHPVTAEFLRRTADLLAAGGVPGALQEPGALSVLGRVVYVQAHSLAYRDSFLLVALVFFAAVLPALMMRRR